MHHKHAILIQNIYLYLNVDILIFDREKMQIKLFINNKKMNLK